MKTNRQTSQQLLDTVWQSLREKDVRKAINTSNLLVQKFPDFAAGWHAASFVAQAIKRPGPALTAIDRALEIQPANIDWQLHRVSCLLICGDNEKTAGLLLTMLAGCNDFNPQQLSQLAFLCNRIEFHDEAAKIYQKLVELEPANGGHWFNLASIQRFKGNIEQAERSLDNAIELNPRDFEAYQLRSDLREQVSASNLIAQLQKLLQEGIDSPAGEVHVCYALAKELEDMGDTEHSFKILSRGANLRRKHINYSIEDDLLTMDAIIDTFDSAVLARTKNGYATKEPIFVIGLPRTGTTLVERILGSHSKVFAAGELNNFALQLIQLTRQNSDITNLSRRELVKRSVELDFELLGKAYLDSTRPRTGVTAHFVDKMPLNFLYAGLIRLALPGAKIIHITRHPMDTCYAIYKRLFQDAYPWSYDLKEIALYYSAYSKLITHWKNVIPGAIYELSYEGLVGDMEGQSRKLLNYCGLAWDPLCMRFYESASVSTTASASQIRQPIYQTSVNRWKAYDLQLSPLSDHLRELGIAVD